MPKPIFLIQVASDLRADRVANIQNTVSQKIQDWHVITTPTLDDGAKLKCSAFHVGNATEIEINDLKALVLQTMNAQSKVK